MWWQVWRSLWSQPHQTPPQPPSPHPPLTRLDTQDTLADGGDLSQWIILLFPLGALIFLFAGGVTPSTAWPAAGFSPQGSHPPWWDWWVGASGSMLCPRPDQSRCVENCKMNSIINRRKKCFKIFAPWCCSLSEVNWNAQLREELLGKSLSRKWRKKHTKLEAKGGQPKVYKYCKSREPFKNIFYREHFNWYWKFTKDVG